MLVTTGVKGKSYPGLSTFYTGCNIYPEKLTSVALMGGRNDRWASWEAQNLSVFRLLLHTEFTWFLIWWRRLEKTGQKAQTWHWLPVVSSWAVVAKSRLPYRTWNKLCYWFLFTLGVLLNTGPCERASAGQLMFLAQCLNRRDYPPSSYRLYAPFTLDLVPV